MKKISEKSLSDDTRKIQYGLIVFRVAMFVAALYFVSNIFDAFTSGSIRVKRHVAVMGEDFGFWVGLARELLGLSICLGLGLIKTPNREADRSPKG